MTAVTVEKNVQDTALEGLKQFGRFHIIQYVWICLALVMVSMLHMNYVFIAEIPEYRCSVPDCENANSSMDTPNWWPTDVESKCHRPVLKEEFLMFNATDHTCSASSFEGKTKCEEWIYENENSIVSVYNLGCDSWQSTLIGTIHNAAMMLSMCLMGWVSDKIGRKPAIIVCSIGGFVGLFKIFAPNLYFYLVLEFLESFLASGLYNVGVIMLAEVGGESKTVAAGVIFSYAVYVGEVVYGILALSMRYWKYLILVIYSPMILFVTYIHLIKESPRWLMINGKMEEVKSNFKSIAKINKLNVTNEEIDAFSDEHIKTQFTVEMQIEKESVKDIIRSTEIMKRLFVSCLCFFTSSLMYYGLAVNSLLLPGDKYANFIMASVTSFPGDLTAFYTLKKFGRRVTLQCGYIVSAAFLIAQVYIPITMPWLRVFLFLIGKWSVVVCFTSVYIYSMELFPTSVRGSLFGVGNTVARAGSMLAPLTPLLATIMLPLPSILFAATAIISAIAVTFTPETKNLPMFDTIAQIHYHKKNLNTNDDITHL